MICHYLLLLKGLQMYYLRANLQMFCSFGRTFMEVVEKAKDLAEMLNSYRKTGWSIAFVPTMGALHQGHLTLVEKAAAARTKTVVSIFVNPTQFTNPDDLKNYPRTVEADLEKLKSVNADVVFIPSAEEMYPSGMEGMNEKEKQEYNFGELENVMEGRFRPGHFKGVAQVVSKLFEMVKPDKAYFGEKDFQQLAVIRQLVKQKNYAIEIIGCETVREQDGLAMSSRNTLLTEENRKEAHAISKALFFIRDNRKDYSLDDIRRTAIKMIEESGTLHVEYLEIAEEETLQPVNEWNDKKLRAFASVKAGNVRLIDNVAL
jgi:pantoate--beta-alanine ligase